jgi:hypothetical protein
MMYHLSCIFYIKNIVQEASPLPAQQIAKLRQLHSLCMHHNYVQMTAQEDVLMAWNISDAIYVVEIIYTRWHSVLPL